ncbi:MAG: hypothetical protein ACR2MX_15560 [Cyclobacteriaceae bacterium]
MDLWFHFILAILATWRVSHLLQVEDGPFDLIFRLREWAGNTFWGKLMDCFYCLSLWVAMLPAIWLANSWKMFFAVWLALSGAAVIIYKLTDQKKVKIPYYEEQ